MSSVDWRVWAYDQLSVDDALLALLPAESMFGAGSIEKPPSKKPFLVIQLGEEVPGPFKAVSRQRLTLYGHDEPGDYMRLGAILRACRSALVGADAQVGAVLAVGGVAVSWQGDSGDLADTDYGTILRTSSYDLHGKDGNAED